MATFTLTNSSTDTIVGTTGNDVINVNVDGDLVGTDKIFGQGGYDKLMMNSAQSILTDTEFAGVHNIQEVDYSSKLTSQVFLSAGANFTQAGITKIDAGLATSDVQINVSAVTSGHLVVTGGLSTNTLNGSVKNDTFRIRADTLTDQDAIIGGGHERPVVANADLRAREGDVVELFLDKGTATVTDAALFNLAGIDTLALSGKATFNLTLGRNAQDGNLDLIDASAASGVVKIDASARSDRYEILFSGTGLTAADMVKGTLGLTTLGITSKAAITDTSFAQVSGVRTIEVVNNESVDSYAGAKIALGAKSLAAGVNRIINNSGEELTVDAGARSDSITFMGGVGNDTFIGTQGQNTFFAGGGDDTLSLKVATFAGSDTFDGGDGTDTFHVLDSNKAATKIVDTDFAGFTSVEKMVFDAKDAQDVTLAATALASGLTTIDASKIAGGLTLDAGSMHQDITVVAGSGADTITLGDFLGHVMITSKQLTNADTLTANGFGTLHFTDTVKLNDAYFSKLQTNVNGFDRLSFDNVAKGQSLTAGNNFAGFIQHSTIQNVQALTDAGFTFDFSKYDGTNVGFLNLIGGAGNDMFLLGITNSAMHYMGGDGTDVFKVSSANFAGAPHIDGGDGFADEIDILDSGTAIVDAALANVSNVEILKLLATKGTGYDVTLGLIAQADKLTTVDASLAGVDVKVDASVLTTERLTATAGAKNNDLTGGANIDTFIFDAKSFNGLDKVDGLGSGTLGDILAFSTGGVIAASAFAGTQHIERLFLSQAGNTVTLTDGLLSTSEGLAGLSLMPDGVAYDFEVGGSKGNDKVDLSLLTDTSKHVLVDAGLGNDTLIGSVGDDSFDFSFDGSLTSADKVNGGLGRDTVFVQIGTYGADVFKGMTSIEEVAFADFNGGTGTKLTLNNDAFKGADLNGDGTKDLTIHLYSGGDSTIDASGVTSRLNHVTAILDNAGNDTFIGGAGADTIAFTDANGLELDGNDKIDGAGGLDTLLLTLTDNTSALTDADLAGLSHVERLEVNTDSGAFNKITLGTNALAAGITEVVDSSPDGAFAMDLDATAFTGDLTVSANTNGSQLKIALGDGDDTVRFTSAFSLLSSDTVDGGNGTNTFDIVGGGTFADSVFTNFQKFTNLVGENGSFDFTLDAKAKAAGFSSVDLSQASSGGGTVTLGNNFTSDLTVLGSDGNDVITGNKSANMTVAGASGADQLTGGTGNDTFVYTLGSDSFMTDKNDTSHADVISSFTGHNSGVGDIIDLTAFGLGGGFTILPGVTATNLTDAVTQVQANASAFDGTHHVAVVNGPTDTFLFVDTNGNDQFDFSTDIAIDLVGTLKVSVFDDSIAT